MKHLLFLLLSFYFFSCQNNNPYDCSIDEKIQASNDSISSLEDFQQTIINFRQEVNEPDLKTGSVKSYRLMNSNSFVYNICSYRIDKSDNGGILTTVKTYKPNYKKSNNVSDTTIIRNISEENWLKIEKAFDSNCFWTLPVSRDRRGFDGGIYWLEAYDPNSNNPIEESYFAAARWSPEEGTEFSNICEAILDLAYPE